MLENKIVKGQSIERKNSNIWVRGYSERTKKKNPFTIGSKEWIYQSNFTRKFIVNIHQSENQTPQHGSQILLDRNLQFRYKINSYQQNIIKNYLDLQYRTLGYN